MGKPLVIVESPTKAKTITKYLEGKYIVKASKGHVRDLPPKELGIDIEGDFTPTYKTIRGQAKILAELRKAAKEADAVYLAPDLDREGEAIAWHIAKALRLPNKKLFRVTFNEITKKAIRKAFKNPGKIAMGKVNAQQARRILDRIVGYQLSPLLWEKFWRGLSAGRVQSVAVRIVAEREKEIQSFKPEEYWEVKAKAIPDKHQDTPFIVDLKKIDKEDPKVSSQAEAKKTAKDIAKQNFAITLVDKKDKRDNPSPPFTTSTLQQQASTRFRFHPKQTMMQAQQLYEGIDIGEEGPVGLITYMRTDSVNVAGEAIEEARGHIKKVFGEKYLPEVPHTYKSKKGAQEAHEAVRPTQVEYTPEKMEQYLTPHQFKLYSLIWERFVASQMHPAVYAVTTVEITGGRYLFRATGRITKFDGYIRLTGTKGKKEDQTLPDVAEGESVSLQEVTPEQHFTQPPPRYNEASLVRALEREGIGRPSTYAHILSTIIQRGYVEDRERKLHASDLGIAVTDKLVKHFPKLMNLEFTSNLEDELDSIEEESSEEGEKPAKDDKPKWVKLLHEFYRFFSVDLARAHKEMTNINTDPEQSEEVCPKCSSPMVYKLNKRGRFLGCSKYPECKTSMSLDGSRTEPEQTDHKCPKCGEPMVIRTGKHGRFLACTGYPKCKTALSINEDGEIEKPDEGEEKCEKCGSPMVVKAGRRGKFIACSAYPDCKNTRSIGGKAEEEEEGEAPTCDKCGSEMVVKASRRGRFWACSAYPNCKNTKPIAGKKAKEPPKETGEMCEKCGKPLLYRVGRGGARFIGCSGYPKCRNTRMLEKEEKEKEPEVDEVCENCGKKMVVKSGPRGKFLACSGYPACKTTKSLKEASSAKKKPSKKKPAKKTGKGKKK
jgi:DNA topoisomerase-1